MALIDILSDRAERQPDQLALVDLKSERRWTYASFDRMAAQWASLLSHAYGVKVGDRIACLSKNRAELVLLHLACARIGAIFAPLNWRLSDMEIAALIDEAEPCLLVGDDELDRRGVSGRQIEAMYAEAECAKPLPLAPLDTDLPSTMIFTSGTSGRPKGALITERSLLRTAISTVELMKVTSQSVFLVDAPMFHIIGIVSCIRPVLLQGGVVLISDGFDPVRTLSRLEDPALGITHYFCVPQMAQRLRAVPSFRADRLQQLTAVFTGGSPLSKTDIDAWLEVGVAIVNGYGMTEAGTVFHMPIDAGVIASKPGSVGQGPSGISARIVDEADEDCPDGVAGEVLLRGESIFSGYWRRSEETAQAFTSDGWFRTGDVALRDSDGYYWLIDRKKDMYISGGENVYPAEVERALAGFPGVAEAGVVGVPDAQWGEVGHLAIVLAPGAEVATADVLAFLSTRIARYKLPKYVSVLDSLPRTASGKMQKAILRERLAQQ